ncbi:MAG: transglycosylase SLT domain-containing protein, partial [Pseudomonadota bacterium]
MAGLALLFACSLPLQADEEHPPEPLQQRTQFLEAKRALEQGQSRRFLQLATPLQEYPLYPYLIYWHLRENLQEQSSANIDAFLKTHGDTPLAPLLRAAWLTHLAENERWPEFLRFYRGSNSSKLRCHAHRAELATGDRRAAWAGAKRLWLVGYSQNKACDPLFEAWEEGGGITDALRWERIGLAMERGNSGLARYLAKALPEAQQRWVKLWRQVDYRPERIDTAELLQQDNEHSRRIALHGIIRLAEKRPTEAVARWPALIQRHAFSAEQRQRFYRSMAMSLAFDGDAGALKWFGMLTPQQLDDSATGWAVRVALRQGRWKKVLEWSERLSPAAQQSEQWRYWRARALEALERESPAQHLYKTLAQERSYYGFLAADRSDSPYNLNHQPLQVEPSALRNLEQKPALVRAHELYHLTLTRDARREWDYAVAQMDRQERLAAGKLADAWKWHDRALLTLARANHWDDLAIRFPLAHFEAIRTEAERHQLDPAWIYAVARQESAFIEDVRSPAGALGLMQLMPATGREIARKLKHSSDSYALLEPATNIR